MDITPIHRLPEGSIHLGGCPSMGGFSRWESLIVHPGDPGYPEAEEELRDEELYGERRRELRRLMARESSRRSTAPTQEEKQAADDRFRRLLDELRSLGRPSGEDDEEQRR